MSKWVKLSFENKPEAFKEIFMYIKNNGGDAEIKIGYMTTDKYFYSYLDDCYITHVIHWKYVKYPKQPKD